MIPHIASAISRVSSRWLAGIALSLLALSACSREPADYATANISPYNHTEDYIHQLYVDEAYGGNSFPYGGGGKFTCCIVYPRLWREGLSATVRWTTSSGIPGIASEPIWHEKVVPIERYERTGTTLNVHFLPDLEVRLIISSKGAGHPEYPGPDAPDPPPDWPPKPPLPEATVPDHAQPPPAPPPGHGAGTLHSDPGTKPSPGDISGDMMQTHSEDQGEDR